MCEMTHEAETRLKQVLEELKACEAKVEELRLIENASKLNARDITGAKLAEQALRESESKFAKLFHYAPIMVTSTSLEEGELLDVNEAFEKIFNYKKEEVLGRTTTDLNIWFNPEDRARVVQAINEKGEVRDREIKFRDRTGNISWGLYAGTIIEIGGKKCLLSIVVDITERKRAEEEHAYLAALVESSDDAIIGWTLDGTISTWNGGAERMYGYSADEAVGKRIFILAPPEKLDEMVGLLEKFLKGERIKHCETVRITKYNKRIHISLSISPILDAKGNAVSASSIARDITEQKLAELHLHESEEHLKYSEERLRLAVESTNLGTFDYSPLTGELIWSNVAKQHFGLPAQAQVDFRTFISGIHRDDREHMNRVIHDLLRPETGGNYNVEYRTIGIQDGKERWIAARGRMLFDHGQATRFIGTTLDITATKQAEQALHESENFKQAILDSLPSHIAVLDKHGTIIAVNQSWLDFAEKNGLPYENIVSEKINYVEVCRKAAHMSDPLAREALEGIEAVLNGRRSEYTLEYPCDSPTRQQWFLMNAVRPNFVFQGAVITHHDITKQKMLEEALRWSENKFITIFKAVPALLAISRLSDGKLIEVNETFLRALEYQRDEVIGQTKREMSLWADPTDRERVVRTLLEQGSIHDMEIRFKGKSGKTFCGLMSAEQIEFGRERYMLSMLKDITERKRMEEDIKRLNTDLEMHASDLETANRELEAFNYTVSHDLRNPLNSMLLFVEGIETFCEDQLNEQCKEYLQGIYNGILKMNRLISTLLDFCSLTKVDLKRETMDLGIIANEVAAELSQSEPGRNVKFQIEKEVIADGDPDLLRMVLMNLMGNAWKYTGKQEAAVIEFGVSEIAGKPTYYVRDNGPGFDMVDAEKLFIPFQRLPGTEKFKGHGIGLATVSRIVQRHGGRVCAEGEPGKGATFYFTLSAT